VASRLTNILTNINKKAQKPVKPKYKKDIKVQLRWIRYDGEDKEVVKPAKGGGCRFVTFEAEENPNFSNLMAKALQIYFINDINFFGEHPWDIEASIADSMETEVDLSEHISTYMSSRGLFQSRTWFFLQTKPIPCDNEAYWNNINASAETASKPCDNESYLNNSDTSEETTPKSVLKRKICSTCSHTYLLNCIHCLQNKEYQESLSKDSLKSKDTEKKSNTSEDITSPPLENVMENDISTNSNSNEENHTDNNAAQLENFIENNVSPKLNVNSNEENYTPLENDISPNVDLIALRQRRLEALNNVKSTTLTDELENLSSSFTSQKKSVTFVIRRRKLYTDVMQKMKIFFSKESLCRIIVEFMSFSSVESCVDTGGPGREMFTL